MRTDIGKEEAAKDAYDEMNTFYQYSEFTLNEVDYLIIELRNLLVGSKQFDKAGEIAAKIQHMLHYNEENLVSSIQETNNNG